MNAITLPPDLEQFADEAVANGRFKDVSDVVRAGLLLLQRAEADRAAFESSLADAIAEGERDGFLTLEEVMRDADQFIEDLAKNQA
jgi:antitoxin ParD1/3/4